jgi:hypothetical protein
VAAAAAAAAAAAQTPDNLKTPTAEEAFNPNGLSQRTIRLLKDAFSDVEGGRATAVNHRTNIQQFSSSMGSSCRQFVIHRSVVSVLWLSKAHQVTGEAEAHKALWRQQDSTSITAQKHL